MRICAVNPLRCFWNGDFRLALTLEGGAPCLVSELRDTIYF